VSIHIQPKRRTLRSIVYADYDETPKSSRFQASNSCDHGRMKTSIASANYWREHIRALQRMVHLKKLKALKMAGGEWETVPTDIARSALNWTTSSVYIFRTSSM